MAKKTFSRKHYIIIMLLLPVLAYLIWMCNLSMKMNSLKDKIASEGCLVEIEDFVKLAEEQKANRTNAIEYIAEAGTLTEWQKYYSSSSKDPMPEYGYLPENFFNLNEEEKNNLGKYLKLHEKQLNALKKAIDVGWFDLDYNWEKGFFADNPNIEKLKNTRYLVKYQTTNLINNDQNTEAAAFLTGYKTLIYNSIYNRPQTLIQSLLKIGAIDMVNDHIAWMVINKSLNYQQLEILYSTNIELIPPKILAYSLEGEFASSKVALDYIDNKQDDLEAVWYRYSGFLKLNYIKWYQFYDVWKSIAKMNYLDTLKILDENEKNIMYLQKHIYKPVITLCPAITRPLSLFAMSSSTEQITKIIIANEMYKNKNGCYAENLEILKDFKNDLNIKDIFTTNENLKYETTIVDGKVTEYIIWSNAEKSESEMKEIVNTMISNNINFKTDLPENLDGYNTVIFRIN